MICPKCKAEYREGFLTCADCEVPLVNELSPLQEVDLPVDLEKSEFEKVFETYDSYEFLDACKVLKDAGVPFTGDEWYTGEFRATRRAQAPYVWAVLVPAERKNEALRLLEEKKAGEPITFSQTETEPMKPKDAWMLLAIMAIFAALMVILIWRG
ncbi:MAG: hypothetical protein CXR31_06960 [Geobacter sp.]|nr:MAG: hypothetical protein CXR31_06960 [Geobacter sp.]